MGANQSNNISSNVDNFNKSKKNKNDLEIIDIDLPAITESETDSINQIFTKLEQISNNKKKNNIVTKKPNKKIYEEQISADSSPFVSTEMFKKLMNENNINSSSLYSTNQFDNVMEGGFSSSSSSSSENDYDDSTSQSTDSSELISALSEITITSDMMPKKKHDDKHHKHHKHHKDKHHKDKHHKDKHNDINSTTSHMTSDIKQTYGFSQTSSDIKQTYGFSQTSSEMIKTSDNNYYINNATTTETPYRVESSEINTSDINLISVDSRHGRRFI